ncbi:hypothetical protein G17_00235 [Escherichia phage vB_EcoM_G17]|nr:hypothetical protein G17_00235 [Escherichia phage vB_EcoM_G17]
MLIYLSVLVISLLVSLAVLKAVAIGRSKLTVLKRVPF